MRNISQRFFKESFLSRGSVVQKAAKGPLPPTSFLRSFMGQVEWPGWGGRQVSAAAANGGIRRPADGSETNQCGINLSVC